MNWIKRNALTVWILIGLVAGLIAGNIAHGMVWDTYHPENYSAFIQKAVKARIPLEFRGFSLFSGIFLSLVKVIVAPLGFSLLLVGLVKTRNFKTMGRIGVKTMIYFTGATLIALSMGLVIVNIFKPGATLH